MADLVLNEWVWADLSRQNGLERQKDVLRLLLRLQASSDRIVVVKNSPFVHKLWRATKSTDPIEVEGAKIFKGMVFDPALCLPLGESDLAAAPDRLACNADDLYLVRAQAAVPGSVVVSSDGDLIDAIRGTGHAAEHRDDWLPTYLSG